MAADGPTRSAGDTREAKTGWEIKTGGGGTTVSAQWGGLRNKREAGRRTSHTNMLTHIHTLTHSRPMGCLEAAQCVHTRQDFTWGTEKQRDVVIVRFWLFVSLCECACVFLSGPSPSSSSRLAPPPVLTWLTLSSVFHLAQQVAVSPPPGQKHWNRSNDQPMC